MKRIHRVFIILLVILLVMTFSDLLAENRKVSAVFVTWEPFGFVRNGKPAGFELDIFSSVMNEMNLDAEFHERPWKRCLYLVEHGLADVVISALKTSERERYLLYPEEHISINKTALFALKGRRFTFDGTFRDLEGFTIGVTDEFSYGEAFDSATYLKKDENTKTESIVAKLIMGRYDLGIGNIPVISAIALKRGVLDKIYFLEPMVHSQMLYAAFSKKNDLESLTRRFSDALREFKQTQQYRLILQQYGVSYESQMP